VIPQRNISLLSNRLAAAGGRRIREDVLERDYCLAWFLAVLSQFSEDLDFTLLEAVPFEDLLRRLEAVYREVWDNSGIAFAFGREDRQKHLNSYTFYLRYIGPLPAGNDVKVDITVREHLVFPLARRPVLRGYEEFTDLPENRLIQVYSLEEIAAEKTVALADRARNEPRDRYDLWHLTANEGIQLDGLTDAICRKLEFRDKPRKGIEAAIPRRGTEEARQAVSSCRPAPAAPGQSPRRRPTI